MNSDELQGKWKQIKGSARQQFGKLTDDDLEMIAGHKDKLIGKLQERYGYMREEASKKADQWLSSMSDSPSGSTQGAQQGQQKQQQHTPPPPSQGSHQQHAPKH